MLGADYEIEHTAVIESEIPSVFFVDLEQRHHARHLLADILNVGFAEKTDTTTILIGKIEGYCLCR